MRVPIVEDDLSMASSVRRGLVAEGLSVRVVPSGDDPLWAAEAHPYGEAASARAPAPGGSVHATNRASSGADVRLSLPAA
jgi:hypothetical protein